MNKVTIQKADPHSNAAQKMMNALWEEIQNRYDFRAPCPFNAADFSGHNACFWIASVNDEPAGSIAITPLSATEAELDIMYVIPAARGSGLAHELLATLEQFAEDKKMKVIKLRCGTPQPEALSFYKREGFRPAAAFGKWTKDDTALCFEKEL